jgi:hypothetical protein
MVGMDLFRWDVAEEADSETEVIFFVFSMEVLAVPFPLIF